MDVIVGSPAYSKKEDVSFVADLNLDLGFAIDDHFNSREGRAYLFQGNGKMLVTNATWFAEGRTQAEYFGSVVAGAGDVNGDKIDDVLISAAHRDVGHYREGFLSLYGGSVTGLTKTASWMHQGLQDFVALTHIGAPAGDVNGDGYDDILMMYPFFDANSNNIDAGRVEIYLGGKSGPGDLPWWSMDGRTNSCWFGISATTVGDHHVGCRPGVVIAQANITNGLDCTSIAVWTNMIASTISIGDSPVPGKQGEPGGPKDLYERALALRKAEKLNEALKSFEHIAPKIERDAEAYLDFENAVYAFWWLGRLQLRFGALDAAIDSFEKAEMVRFKNLHYDHNDTRLSAIIEVTLLMLDRRLCLMEQGKTAAAHHVLDEILHLSEDMLIEDAQNKDAKLPWQTVFMIYIEREVARQRLQVGEMNEYEKSMMDLLQQAKSVHLQHWTDWIEENYAVKGLLDDLAEFAFFSEEYSRAAAYSKERVELPVRDQYAFEDQLASLRHAKYLSFKDGVSEKNLTMATVALEKLRDTRDTGFILRGRIIFAEILNDLGRTSDALDMLNAVVSEANDRKHHKTQADAQVVRSRCLLKLNRPIEAARDCLEALALRRGLGLKYQEPEVYELYALALGASGQTALAIQTWNNAFDLCMSLNLHFRALHMLLGLAHLYLEDGNAPEADRVWQRIEAFLRQYPKMPAPTMARYQKEKSAFVAFISNHEKRWTAENAVKSRQAEIAKKQQKMARPGNTGSPEPMPEENGSIALADNRTPVISPVSIRTQVNADEYAHARFFLFNTNADTLTGDLVLNGVATAEWSITGLWWTVDVDRGAITDRAVQAISIPSGEARVVYLQTMAAHSNGQEKVTLQWNGSTNASAEWFLASSGDSRQTAIVNVSQEKTNPFFHSTFYHELYYRGTNATVENIRVVSSVPCRVEFLSIRTGRIVAVDANGDGDFEDAGDVLNQDMDADTYPDFYFDRTHNVEPLELLVFPAAQDLGAADKIELNLYIKGEGSWQHQGTDILLLR
ncbi:MAG: hypothetical protein WCI95_07545 [bacterium]